MVFFDTTGVGLSNEQFAKALADRGVHVGLMRGQIRAVTHIDVSPDDIDMTLEVAAVIANASYRGMPSADT
ncbi:hypothetical protein A176_005155 [Myxococcus hansupus]|uniref:Low-specificity L-threonine aldolase n=1 Tax=Pseudomyxococcus hansupus TaxID=1297742 RepID=A0A0H4X2W7_9BACT|nr:hypothetical protein A176_005155 [Myxococcus hansupus]